MKKIIAISVCVVIIALLITAFAFDFFETEPSNDYYVDFLGNQETVEAVMTDYFDFYKTHGLKNRLSDYRINEITICEEKDEEIVFNVNYDVKPLLGEYSDEWFAGNGTADGNGWCVGKSAYYKITRENRKYILEYIGTML